MDLRKKKKRGGWRKDLKTPRPLRAPHYSLYDVL
jgi:hypothetical protein